MAVKMLTKYIDNSSGQTINKNTLPFGDTPYTNEIQNSFINDNKIIYAETNDAYELNVVFADVESYNSYSQALHSSAECVAENLASYIVLQQHNISQIRTVNYNFET